MKYITLFIFIQYWIIYQRYSFADAKAIVGHNIRVAGSGTFSFVVSISVRNPVRNAELDHLCTATLITMQHVLTAEHCMRCSLVLCRVLVGSVDLKKAKRYKVESWISYDQWARAQDIEPEYVKNDIVVVTLEKCVRNHNIQLPTISEVETSDLYSLRAVIAGWGTSNTGRINTVLETVELNVLTPSECQERIDRCANETTGAMPDSLICTVANPYALLGCGDSGGPLLDLNNNIIGINLATCPINDVEVNPLEVNIHISIPYYREFIMCNIH